MSPGPISRRGLVVGGAAMLGAVALPAGVVEAVAAEISSTGIAGALPAVFDPRAFCRDIIDAGHRVTVVRPVWIGSEDEDLRPYYLVRSEAGRRFGDASAAVLAKWRAAIEACPDHVERVVDYGLGQIGG